VALFGDDSVKDELLIERLNLTIDNLRERLQEKDALVDKLLAQVTSLQDALVSREAPQAYSNMIRDRFESSKTEEQIKEEENRKREMKVAGEYMKLMEKDRVFESVDDLNKMFLPLLMEDSEPDAIHDNSES